MEFSEKLQMLRAQKGWTQEQLAERLFVSRTAVSKWESGKGYPSIDSLKALAAVFDVTIDALLSSEELLSACEDETHAMRQAHLYKLLAWLDVGALAFILLPLYGKTIEGYIYSAMLWAPPDAILVVRLCYWAFALGLCGLGIAALVALYLKKDRLVGRLQRLSVGLNIGAVAFFIATGEPYAAMLAFVLLLCKGALLYKNNEKE